MALDRRARVGWGALAALALLSALCLAGCYRYRALAFPEHAVNFTVGREQATQQARAFLTQTLHQPLDGYQEATTFTTDDQAKTYLEKTVGVARTTAIGGETDLWAFNVRFFQPQRHEEYRVSVAPDGRIVGYTHIVDDNLSGAHLSSAQAFAIAEQFRRTVVRAPGSWYLAQTTSTTRSDRLDWHFEWIRRDFRIFPGSKGDANEGWERMGMDIQGDEVGGFDESLAVPESWTRQYEGIRSTNSLLVNVDDAFGVLPLALAALVVIGRGLRRRDLRWRAPALLAGIGGLLAALSEVNAWPVYVAGYNKDLSWTAFTVQIGAQALLSGLAYALLIFGFALAGERVYRARFPGLLSLGGSFRWRGVASLPGARAIAVGGLATSLMAAYQIAYYVAGKRIGIWSPADVPYNDLYSTVAPWFYSLSTGYTAAASEEFAFRLFAIPLLLGLFLRLFRRRGPATALAIVLSALVWALLHSTYPEDPFFARGLELTIVGSCFGWLFVRYGILASLTVHFCFDAFVVAVALEHAQAPGASVAAYALTALPLLIAVAAALRARLRHGFADAALLYNGALAAPEPPPAPRLAPSPLAWRYDGLPRRLRWLVLVGGAAGALCLLLAPAAPAHPFALDRAQATALADAALTRAGVDVRGYQRIVTIERRQDTEARAYLREQGGDAAVAAVYGRVIPDAVWQVRYVRPLQRDEYRVQLWPDTPPATPPFALTFDVSGDTPGAKLSPRQAEEIARQALAFEPGWGDGRDAHVTSATPTQPGGHSALWLTFQRADSSNVPAPLTASLVVVGDHVSGYYPSVVVPAAWTAAHDATGARQALAGLAAAALALGLAVLLLATFIGTLRAGRLRLRVGLGAGAGFAALAAIDALNGLPTLLKGYPTALPLQTYVTGQLATQAAQIVLLSLLAGGGAALLHALWQDQAQAGLIPRRNARGWAWDTTVLGLSLPCMLLGLAALSGATRGGSLLGASFVNDGAPSGAESIVPALAALAALRWVLLGVLGALTLYLTLRRFVRRDRWVIALFLLPPALAALAEHTWSAAAADLLQGLILVATTAAFARGLLRANLLAYALPAVLLTLLGSALTDLHTGNFWFGVNGLLLLLLSVALLAAVQGLGKRQAAEADDASGDPLLETPTLVGALAPGPA